MRIRTPHDAVAHVRAVGAVWNPVALASGVRRGFPMLPGTTLDPDTFPRESSHLSYLLACGAPTPDLVTAAASLTAYARFQVGDFVGLGFTIGDAWAIAPTDDDRAALTLVAADLVGRVAVVAEDDDWSLYAQQPETLRVFARYLWPALVRLDAAALFDKPGHFLHAARATDEPGFVAYHESRAKLVADRQTRLKFGRYLSRFFGDRLSPAYVQAIAELYARRAGVDQGRPPIAYARTREDIRAVYAVTDGLASCMTKPADRFKTNGVHPVEVYAAGDFAVATLHRDDRLVARAVVCGPVADSAPCYVRIYAVDAVAVEHLRAGLVADGYVKRDSFPHGARLLRIETDDGGTVCPYIDGDGADIYASADDIDVMFYGDAPTRAQRGPHLGHSQASHHTGGLAAEVEDDRTPCDDCGDLEDEDELHYVETADANVCSHCLERNFTYARTASRHGREHVRDGDAIIAEDGAAFADAEAAEWHQYAQIDDGEWHPLAALVFDEVADEYIRGHDAVEAWTPAGDVVVTHQDNATRVADEWFADDDDHARALHLDVDQATARPRVWFLPDEEPRAFHSGPARWLACRSTLGFRVPVAVHSPCVRDVAFGRDDAGAFWITWTDTSGAELVYHRDSVAPSVVHDIHPGDADDAGALVLDPLTETTAPLPIPDGLGAPVALAA